MNGICKQRRQFLTMAAGLLAAGAAPAWALGASGEVKSLSGQAWRNGQALKLGDPISHGDLLKTGEASSLVVRVEDNVYLLRSGTELQLARKGWVQDGLRLLSGALLAVFAKGNQQIMTPTVTAGIRGTGVYAEARENETYFCLCYGEVELKPMHQSGELMRFRASTHTAHTFDATGGVKKSPLRDHTDDELAILEALAGRQPHRA